MPAAVQPANAVVPEYASPAQAPAAPDIETRMAMLMDARRQENSKRKQQVKKTYLIIVTAIMAPSFLYVFVTLFKLLAR